MKFVWSESDKLHGSVRVKVKRMNHVVHAMAVSSTSSAFTQIRKLSKTEFVLLETGEVREYNLSENRGQNVAGLKDSFRKFRDLANNNFVGGQNELSITLTYAENMTDAQRLYRDFEAFWKRFKRKFGSGWDYLTAVEPQGRGAWHIHGLLRCNDGSKVFVANDVLRDLWKQGWVTVKSLEGVDNIGAYLSAYLTDVEITPENIGMVLTGGAEVKNVVVDGQTKQFIKGGRVHMYPPGMNFFRHSRGIVAPDVEEMLAGDLKEIVGDATPNYSKTLQIVDDDTERVVNRVTYLQYNLKRQ